MPWQPSTHEPDALATALREAVRTHLFPGEPGRIAFAPLPDGQGRRAVLEDGSAVSVNLVAKPETRTRHGERPCAGIRLDGHMTHGGRGYRVTAEVLVDRATRAMLSCETTRHDVGVIPNGDLRR